MTSLDRKLAHEALSPYVSGTTLHLGRAPDTAIEGSAWIDCGRGVDVKAFAGFADASVDAIVAASAVEWADDSVQMLVEWRRVLAEGGRLAVVLDASSRGDAPHRYTPDAWQNLLRTVGGFELVRLAELDDGNGWLVVAERHVTLDLRNLLGSHGAALADAARRGVEQRAELCFQFGTILLRAGELDPAVSCFLSMLEHMPDNSEGLFGIGMCYALAKQYATARDWLQRAIDADEGNAEAKRWLGMVQLELDAGSSSIAPQSMQAPQRRSKI